jgi:xanthine dehydrogenase YagS FAD-binding subunit
MLPRFSYVRPVSLDEAMEHLRDPGAVAHAGGTDLLGCLRDEALSAEKVVSLAGLDQLRGMSETRDGGLRIGALTGIAEMAESKVIQERYPGLAQAAGAVASPQIRNQGTLGGNLCQRPRCWYFRGEFHCLKKGGETCYAVDSQNQFHAIFGGYPCFIVHPSDTAPMLLALGATARIAGSGGIQSVPMEEFFVLPEDRLEAENVLAQGEVLVEVVLPRGEIGATSSYRKARERGAWDFALASVAISAVMAGDKVVSSRLVLGGVAPKPWRLEGVEKILEGQSLVPEVVSRAAAAAVEGASPLDHNGYKVDLVKGLVEESLGALVS